MRQGNSFEECSRSVLSTTGSVSSANSRLRLSAARLIASVALEVKIISYLSMGAPSAPEQIDFTSRITSCLTCSGWRNVWRKVFHIGVKVGVLALLSRLINGTTPFIVWTQIPRPISVCRSSSSNFRPEYFSRSSW